jgi:CRISPR-associated endonuclease Csn1
MTAFKYYLGLDMGTNSVGWAATDPEYRLLKAKGKDLWGIREFNEASGAVERRTHRISRRRRQREQVRIGILKDYFHDAICEVDPGFFQRLENSKYHEEDKDVEVRYKNNIFNDSNYTDKDYFNEYPTIYHLRNELISSTEKHDVRLVFLALLNMFKHRGHFLNAGLGENNGESNIDNAYFELTELLSELTEYHLSQDIDCKQIEAILSRRDMSRTHKAEELAGVLHVDLKNKPYKELIRGLCGLKFNACVVFPDVQSEEVTKLDICLSESTFDEKSDEIANIIGEDYFEIIMAMKEMFDIGWLAFDGENIVGTSGMSFVEKPPYFGCPSGKIGLLSSMFTNPDYRRKGIAKELLSRVVNDAREYGCGTVQITASDMGVKLYTDFGFVHNDNFMQYKI